MRFIFILFVALFLLPAVGSAEQPPSAQDDTPLLAAAKTEIEEKNYDAGYKILLQLAEKNNASAQYHLAQLYEYGYGVKKDNDEAFKWYRKAAELGEVNAETDLGAIYQIGWSGTAPKNDKEALKWWRRAADQGYAPAQNMVGTAYENGVGVSKDDAEALKWYHRSAAQGFAAGEYSLAKLYFRGVGNSKPDNIEAYFWDSIASIGAADDDHVDALVRAAARQAQDEFSRQISKEQKEIVDNRVLAWQPMLEPITSTAPISK